MLTGRVYFTDGLLESEYAISIFYPVAIISILTFLVVNLFVACVCFGFSASAVDEGDAEEDEQPLSPTIVEDLKDDGGVRARMRAVFETKEFEWLLLSFICLNMIVLATITPEMEDWHQTLFDICELAFTIIFVIEMTLKIFAYGTRGYLVDGWNKFDGVITLLSVLSIILDLTTESRSTGGFMVFRALRMFRILRVTRGIKTFRSVHDTLHGLSNSFPALCAVLLILMVVFLIFGTMGHDLFKDKFGESRQNFDTFLNSILCLSQVVTADDWEPLMYTAMDAPQTGYAAVAFFIIFWMISSFILLNLVIAAILDAVQSSQSDPSDSTDELERSGSEQNEQPNAQVHPEGGAIGEKLDCENDTPPPAVGISCLCAFARSVVDFTLELPWPAYNCDPDPETETGILAMTGKCKFSWASITVNWFEFTMLLHVLASNAVLMYDTRGKKNNLLNSDSDGAFTYYLLFVFTIEFVLKIVANGIFSVPVSNKVAPESSLTSNQVSDAYKAEQPDPAAEQKEDSMDIATSEPCVTESPRIAYFRSPWNVLDVIVLFFSYIDVCTSCVGQNSSCSTLRAGRLARPFRMLGHFEGMQKVIVAFALSCPSLLSVIVVSNGIYFCFAVIGVEMFGNMLTWCNDSSALGKSDCLGMFTNDMNVMVPREWVSWSRNFDNVGEAYLTLFEVASLDAWAEVLYAAMDVTGKDLQPKQNSSSWSAIYFVAFVFFGSLFVLQLLVTIVIDMYGKSNGIGSLDAEQQAFINLEQMKEFLSPATFPKRPKQNKFRQVCYDICVPWDKTVPTTSETSCWTKVERFVRSYFDNFITACIFINLGMQCTRHRSMSEAWENALLWGDVGFLMIFCIELIVRVAAYTPKMYFSDSWNIVDAGVVVVSLMATPFKSKITRGCRVLRMIRLLKNIEMFKMITTVMIASVKQIWYVLLVLALIMFTWAVFGIERFGEVKHGFTIDKHTNFADFSNAIYTLTQVMFGSWIYVRKDCRVKWPDCTPGSDCGSWMATPYFLSYLLINSFIMVRHLQP